MTQAINPTRRAIALRSRSALLLATLAAAAPACAQISFGEFSNFDDTSLTTQGWKIGITGPNPSNEAGGPGGATDHYLKHISGGGFSTKQIFYNDSNWAGNFVSAHVTRIQFQAANFSAGPTPETLHIRLAALREPFGSRRAYSTIDSVTLPPDGVWRTLTFDISPSGMVSVEGAATYSEVLGHVDQFRILSAEFPYYQGDGIDSVLGVDNIRALTLPGDADFDNAVDTDDFNLLASNFNQANKSWGDGDFNFDKTVNALDFNALATNFGQSIAPSAPLGAVVPEPGIASVLAAMVAFASRRRRF